MRARHTAVGIAVIAAVGVVWQAVPASQQSGWHIVDLDVGQSSNPDVTVDAAGNTVAVWTNQARTRTARFTAATGTWTPAATVSNQTDLSSEPRVASNSAGDAVAAWRAVRSSDATAYIAVSCYSAATNTWSNVLELPTKGYLPRALVDGQGNITVVWAEFLRDEGFYYGWVHEMRSVHYDAATATWSSPITLSGEYAWQLELVMDGAGDITAVWGRDQFVESVRWSPGTKSWSPVTAIFTATVYTVGQDYSPQLAVDAAGNVMALWNEFYGALSGSRFSAATQTWNLPAVVASDGSTGSQASLAVDAAGNATAVYVARQSASAGILRSRTYLTSTQVWSEPIDIATDVRAGSARVAVDPSGNAAVAWLMPDGSLQAAQRPFGGQWSVDAGSENSVSAPRIAADAAGSIHLLWRRQAPPQALRAARRNTLIAPTIRRVTSSSGALTVDFTPVAAASNYEYSVDDGATWTPRTPPSAQAPVVVDGLVDGVAYSLRLRAISLTVISAPSNVAIATPGLAPPLDLRAATISGNSVTFAWAPPSSGISPTGYVLDGGPTPGSELARVPSPGTGTILLIAAPVGVFHVRVRATLGDVESEPSSEIRINVGVAEPPSPPAGLLGLADQSSVTLTWQNTFSGGGPTGIVLDVTGTTAGSIPLPLTDRFTVAGVPPDTYSVSARAVNASGSSVPSNAVSLTFPGTCAPPHVPTDFSVSAFGPTIVGYWSPPAGGAAPSGYVVMVTGSFEGSLPTPGLTLSGTAGPGTYVLRVAATNSCGTGPATPPKTVTIPASAAGDR